jgi:hypothetical protein
VSILRKLVDRFLVVFPVVASCSLDSRENLLPASVFYLFFVNQPLYSFANKSVCAVAFAARNPSLTSFSNSGVRVIVI